jgi:hypothetical protein
MSWGEGGGERTSRMCKQWSGNLSRKLSETGPTNRARIGLSDSDGARCAKSEAPTLSAGVSIRA